MPIQPDSGLSEAGVQYKEISPAPFLSDDIYCYWELKAEKFTGHPFLYRVVSDGCIDIFFETGDFQNLYLMGFTPEASEFLLQPGFHYMGIRFLPGVFPSVFQVSASELSRRYIHLGDVLPKHASILKDRFYDLKGVEVLKQVFDPIFTKWITERPVNTDERFLYSLYSILERKGMENIYRLDSGTSQRQLRRLYDFYIGASPKVFSRVVRFQSVLRDVAFRSNRGLYRNFYDFGYYDQAHFIREFKTMAGTTPGHFLQKKGSLETSTC